VIGGYVPGTHGLGSIIVGYYKGDDLIYVARVRNGFVPASRRQVFERLRPLITPECPFANLPETHRSRWGEGLTAEDMKKCVWARPELVARIEFLEWTRKRPSSAFEIRRIARGQRRWRCGQGTGRILTRTPLSTTGSMCGTPARAPFVGEPFALLGYMAYAYS
jgi:ATP-dependent DNA ligase